MSEPGGPGAEAQALAAPDAGALAVADAGAVRNTLLQLASQVVGLVFTGGLTLFLVRSLGASGYGLYGLAISISGLLVLPAGMGLPHALGRFLADHRSDVRQVRAILSLGLRIEAPAGLLASAALLATAGLIAHAYGHPRLAWPLRWAALSVGGQALFNLLAAAVASVRQSAVSVWMALVESAVETAAGVSLVLAGAGAAGAVLGKVAGYAVAGVAGTYLVGRLLGGRRRRASAQAVERAIGPRALLAYAGAMFLVDVGFSAIAQLDILLIAALLSTAAVGQFSAVLRVLTVLGYIGLAVSSGVAPRVARGSGGPDTRAFSEALRYLIVVHGMVIAPLLVWAGPIVGLVLGPGYGRSPEIMRVLAPFYFLAGPAGLVTVSVTYLGEGRRRVAIVAATLVLGLAATYALLRTVGLVGAAIGDDIIEVVWVGAHLRICHRLLGLDLERLGLCAARSLLAAAAMALPLLAAGTGRLAPAGWVLGACGSAIAYLVVLLVTRELSLSELRALGARLWHGVRTR
jgi:stage V sporulation protein B